MGKKMINLQSDDGANVFIESDGVKEYDMGAFSMGSGMHSSKRSGKSRKSNSILFGEIGPGNQGFSKMAFLAIVIAFVVILVVLFAWRV
ncbi:MAG: hypothetical protein Q4G04_00265 [bacterium]|nr:hypothetical protein [bacterium]